MRSSQRIGTVLLAATLAATPLQAQQAATAADVRAVLAAVLAHQASIRGPESGAETCVAASLVGQPVGPGADAEDDPLQPNHSVRIYFQWHVPDAPPPPRVAPPPEPAGGNNRNRRGRPRVEPPSPPAPLATAEAERLSALRAEAARAPATPNPVRIDETLVTPPLRLERPNDDCAFITLSAPAFAGDAAFVEYAYACGTVCGNGGLYALQRREGRWAPVGIADIWIR